MFYSLWVSYDSSHFHGGVTHAVAVELCQAMSVRVLVAAIWLRWSPVGEEKLDWPLEKS